MCLVATFDSILIDSSKPDKPSAGGTADWARAASALMASGRKETGLNLALRLWKESAGDLEAAILASEVLSADVPIWHFSLVRDHRRNAAYDAALKNAMRPGMRVLDIGSGTGLLALVAARAGAERVYSCEMNPAVADAAREIVELNGYSGKVQILSRHSNEIVADTELGGRVDLIVSEIIGNSMLSEGALATMQHAVTNLLKPGGKVIPAKGTVRVALAFDSRASDRRMGIVDGFDLTPFNRLAQPAYSVLVSDRHLRLMSDAADLFEFDFRATVARTKARTQVHLVAKGGPVNCVAQWIHLQIDDDVVYENEPGTLDFSNWGIVLHPLAREVSPNAGDSIPVNASHDLTNVRIWSSGENG
jgi:type III protein arginine methyltransferase